MILNAFKEDNVQYSVILFMHPRGADLAGHRKRPTDVSGRHKPIFHVRFFFFILSSVLGKVRSAVGSAQLLISQKFQQFRGLCDQNLVCIMPEIPVGVRAKLLPGVQTTELHQDL